MAKKYPTVVDVNVWKEHCCVGCGTVYRYLFTRKKVGYGNTPEDARDNAHAVVIQSLANEVDMQPCPDCGRYQPDMIAVRRWQRHGYVCLVNLFVVVGLGYLATVDDLPECPLSLLTWGAIGMVGILALAHLVIDLHNPNTNLEANRARARKRLNGGDLWTPGEKKPDEVRAVGTGVTRGLLACYLVLAASAVAFLGPVGVQRTGGMECNAGCSPEVVGPGETTCVYFPTRISSIRGMWNGKARIFLLNADELSLPGLPPAVGVSTSAQAWGTQIPFGSKDKNYDSVLWAMVYLPGNPSLKGKKLTFRIDMDVRYPHLGNNNYQVKVETYSHTTSLVVSSPGAGMTYVLVWWFSFIAGAGLAVLGGALLAVVALRFRQKAAATSIFEPRTPEESERIGHISLARERPRRADHDEEERDERYRR